MPPPAFSFVPHESLVKFGVQSWRFFACKKKKEPPYDMKRDPLRPPGPEPNGMSVSLGHPPAPSRCVYVVLPAVIGVLVLTMP